MGTRRHAVFVALAALLGASGCAGPMMTRAAAAGDLRRVRWLMKARVSVNAEDADGTTPLMAAAGAGHLATVRFLLDQGARAGLRDARGVSAHGYAYGAQRGVVTPASGGLAAIGGPETRGRRVFVFTPHPKGDFVIYAPRLPSDPQRREIVRLLDERRAIEDPVGALGLFAERGDLTRVRELLRSVRQRPDSAMIAREIEDAYPFGRVCAASITTGIDLSVEELHRVLPRPAQPVLRGPPRAMARTFGEALPDVVPVTGGYLLVF